MGYVEFSEKFIGCEKERESKYKTEVTNYLIKCKEYIPPLDTEASSLFKKEFRRHQQKELYILYGISLSQR